jgi:hypothetical protein
MTHQQAADPAALEVLFDGEGQFGAAPRGGSFLEIGMIGFNPGSPADDSLTILV